MEEAIANSKFEAKTVAEDGKTVVYLSGQIDEDALFDSFAKEKGPLVFDFDKVTVINSCGVRNWVNYMKTIKGEEVAFRNCTPVIVKQLNLVPSFRGDAKVLSLYVPYVCMSCDFEKRILVDMEELNNGKELPEVLTCDDCGEEDMEIDGDEKQFKLAG